MSRFLLTVDSANHKTHLPTSITSRDSCPQACPMRGTRDCYAEGWGLRFGWNRVDRGGGRATDLRGFLAQVAALPVGQVWRHNQAGDLPGLGDWIDREALRALARANAGRRGFTYTHKPVEPSYLGSATLPLANCSAVAEANSQGFAINLSANSLRHADALLALAIGPVVAIVPHDAPDKPTTTPGGRHVVICPAQTAAGEARGVSCASCQLCAVASRKSVVAFKAHGEARKRLSLKVIT